MNKATKHLRHQPATTAFSAAALAAALLFVGGSEGAEKQTPTPRPTPTPVKKTAGTTTAKTGGAMSKEKARIVAAAHRAAAFLLSQANKDGTFGTSRARFMPGVVGLAVLALAESPDKLRESNCPQVAAAAKYLVSRQIKKGPSKGAVAIPRFGLENYNTSVAVMALVALENPAYKDVLKKAKKFILSCQLNKKAGFDPNKHKEAYGAIGYGDAKQGDVSNTSFGIEALKKLGLKKGSPAFKNAVKFLKRCQDNSETNDAEVMKGGDDTGGFTYRPGDSEFGKVRARSGKMVPRPYGNMTYAAVKALIYCGMSMDDPVMAAAWKWIRNNYSVERNPGGKGNQGYYYYVVALAKAFTAAKVKELTLADGRKVRWSHDLARRLLTLQRRNGSFANRERRWMESDPVLATSYALIALNLCLADQE